MRKSDIRYPRATTDPGPAEGHIASENIKCQVCGNMHGKGCGLHGITIPAATSALKEICRKLIGPNDNSVTVIFPDSR